MFVLVIANVPTLVEFVMPQVDGPITTRLTAQLIKGIWRIL